ncbi:hypothetical protein OIO90_000651 [Microbotryomycetes sp. JL221]|nr:hypothetical protein OIO90_000651 [Microbotryomycetes sp. JL221]
MGLLSRIKSRSQSDLKQSRATTTTNTAPAVPRLPSKGQDTSNDRQQHNVDAKEARIRHSQITNGLETTGRARTSARDDLNTHDKFASRSLPRGVTNDRHSTHGHQLQQQQQQPHRQQHHSVNKQRSSYMPQQQQRPSSVAHQHESAQQYTRSSPQLSLHGGNDQDNLNEQEIMLNEEFRNVLIGARKRPDGLPSRRDSLLNDVALSNGIVIAASDSRGSSPVPEGQHVPRPPRRDSLIPRDFDPSMLPSSTPEKVSADHTPSSSAATTPKPALTPLQPVNVVPPGYPVLSTAQTFFGASPTMSQTSWDVGAGGSGSPNLSANSLTSSQTHESTTPHTPPLANDVQRFTQTDPKRTRSESQVYENGASPARVTSVLVTGSPETTKSLPRSPKLSSAEVDEARLSLQRLDASFGGHSSDSSSSFSKLSTGDIGRQREAARSGSDGGGGGLSIDTTSRDVSPSSISPRVLSPLQSAANAATYHLPPPRQRSPERDRASAQDQQQLQQQSRSTSNLQTTPVARSSAQFKATVSPPSPRTNTTFSDNKANKTSSFASKNALPHINTQTQARHASISPSGRQSVYSSPVAPSPVPSTQLRSQLERAFVLLPDRILSRVLANLDYSDIFNLRFVSKSLRRCFQVEAKELVLQRFLNHFGYRSILRPIPATSSRPVSPNGAASLQHSTPTPDRASRTLTSSTSSSVRSSVLSSPSTSVIRHIVDPVSLSLRDLDLFLMGYATPIDHFAQFAKEYNQDRLHPRTLLLSRASTRAWNRVVARIRLQSSLNPNLLSQPLYSGLVPAPIGTDNQVYKAGRAPCFRVWVPTGQGQGSEWMTDTELVECEREIWRAGVWNELRKGDVVVNVAIARFGSLGRLIFDGKFLRDFMYKYDMIGHLPNWLNGICFPPAFWHNIVASSTPFPIVYLGLSAFVNQLRANLTLQESQVSVSSPQGRYLVKTFVYCSTIRIRPGTIVGSTSNSSNSTSAIEVVHDDWCGELVVETDGTNEHAGLLVARASSLEPMPYRIIREKSRPGQLWIRPVMDNEALA